MATPTPDAVAMFMRITGASEFVAVQKLEEFGGNLNEAVNAHFIEGDRPIQRKNVAAAPQYNYTDVNNQNRVGSRGILPFLSAARRFRPSLLLDPNYRRELRDLYNRIGAAGFNSHAPYTSQPGDAREVPAGIHSGFEQPYQSGLSSTSADMTGNVLSRGQRISGTDDYQNDYSLAQPNTSHVPDNDIEEEMIQAAIEASKQESRECPSGKQSGALNGSSDVVLPQSKFNQEDDDLARAISLSLKMVEQEKAIRENQVEERKKGLGLRNLLAKVKKTNSSSSRWEPGTSSNPNVAQNVTQPVMVQPSNHSASDHLQGNEYVFISKEWGGISSDELNEAVLLETALFGEIPDNSSHKFSSLPDLKHHPGKIVDPKMQSLSNPASQSLIAAQLLREQQDADYLASLLAEKIVDPRIQSLSNPASQSLADTQLLRAQQDADYLASLLADKQKELNALKEAETCCMKEEESCKKMLERKELEKMLDKKEVSLPKEPLLDDKNAITVVVRMPDGSRRGRRFLKTDKLQVLFDFIDICGALKPGTYRVVKSYPRRAFSINDSLLTLNEVGLCSRNEALFLELI